MGFFGIWRSAARSTATAWWTWGAGWRSSAMSASMWHWWRPRVASLLALVFRWWFIAVGRWMGWHWPASISRRLSFGRTMTTFSRVFWTWRWTTTCLLSRHGSSTWSCHLFYGSMKKNSENICKRFTMLSCCVYNYQFDILSSVNAIQHGKFNTEVGKIHHTIRCGRSCAWFWKLFSWIAISFSVISYRFPFFVNKNIANENSNNQAVQNCFDSSREFLRMRTANWLYGQISSR